MIQPDRFWKGFCRALGLDPLIVDPRFDSHMLRTENSADFRQLITNLFMVRTQDESASLLDEGRCIWAPIQTLDEVIDDPQVIANEFRSTKEPPEDREFQIATVPMKFHRTPAEVAELAPELGQRAVGCPSQPTGKLLRISQSKNGHKHAILQADGYFN